MTAMTTTMTTTMMKTTTTTMTTVANSPTTAVARAAVQGEHLEAAARLVVSPSGGVFELAQGVGPGSTVAKGQVVGHLMAGSERTPVVSHFAGQTGAALAWTGERLQTHQPVMWLALDAGTP